jgi:peptide maturation system protein (TIGR04066 family)
LKQRATVYPYGKEDVQIFRYAHLIDKFEPVCPVAPSGWGEFGMDATEIDGGETCGYKISIDLESALDQTDLLVLTSFKNYHGEKGNFDAVLEMAGRKVKDMIILELPKVYNQDMLIALKSVGRVKEVYSEQNRIRNLNSRIRHKVEVPVVLVFGDGPFTDKFEVQLALRVELLKRNYRVTQVGSRGYAELFGFHSFPAFMQSLELKEAEKIIGFNQYLKRLEIEEKPDLIVIGVPQGLVPVTEEIHNDFGIVLLEAAAASEPDLLVNTLYNLDYPEKYYNMKAEYTLGILGCQVGCFVLSNTWLDLMNTKNEGILKTTTIRKKRKQSVVSVDPKPDEIFPVISLCQDKAAEAITDAVISKLQSFGQIKLV